MMQCTSFILAHLHHSRRTPRGDWNPIGVPERFQFILMCSLILMASIFPPFLQHSGLLSVPTIGFDNL
jgi:hypothetical protein